MNSRVSARRAPRSFALPFVLFCLVLTAVAPATAAELTWRRLGGGCGGSTVTSGPTLSCGSYGTYVFGDNAGGTSALATTDQALFGGNCTDSTSTNSEEHMLLPSAPDTLSFMDWQPCASGSCLTSSPTGPWVAVVDWRSEHGYTVAQTILDAADHRVEARLFAVDDPHPAIPSGTGVGDAQVLAQLCSIANLRPASRPTLVNMSFGRYASGCNNLSSHSLRCEIERVMDGLEGEGTHFVAAAGNHGRLLFPAAADATLAVGSIDLANLVETGSLTPSHQTPAGHDALFPGYGIVLVDPTGQTWPAPPGSSYAAALASGWIAGYLVDHPEMTTQVFDGAGLLGPQATSTGFVLARNGLTLPGSELPMPSLLTDVALGAEPDVCLHGAHSAIAHDVQVEMEITGLPTTTFSDIQRSVNRPTPESEPCLPCHDIPPLGDQGGGVMTGDLDAGLTVGAGTITDVPGDSALIDTLIASRTELTIDLSGSAGIPSERQLLGLYLRVGERTYRFSDSEHSGLLADLAAGQVEHLHISNLPLEAFRDQVSLVWLERLSSGTVRDTFLSESPVAVHGHR